MQHHPPNLAAYQARQVYGEHYFSVDASQPVKAVVERMRDQACPIAVIVRDEKVVGIVDGGSVLQNVVARPEQWAAEVATIAAPAVTVSADAPAESLRQHTSAVVVINSDGKPVKVVSRATWMKFLNTHINTSIFMASPHHEAVERPTALSK